MYDAWSWYAACRGDELLETPIARTIVDLPLVRYRDARGVAHALLDRCAHRNAPLSRIGQTGAVLPRSSGKGRSVTSKIDGKADA